MSRIWTIAAHQMAEDMLKRGFLFLLLSLPLLVAFTVGLGYLNYRLNQHTVRLGVVDQASALVVLPPPPADVEVVVYETPDMAAQALSDGQIDAYYVLGPDYPATGHAELVFATQPPYGAMRYFETALRQNLVADQPPDVIQRVLLGARIGVLALDSGRAYPTAGPTAGMVAPIVVALLFAFMVMVLAGTLMEVVVKEKENRTMEVIISSVSPGQMMAGKIIGGLGVALALLLAWLLVLILAAWLGATVLDVAWLQDLSINWRDVGLLALVAIPSMLCLTALMTAAGATLVEAQEAQQMGPLLFLGLMLPLYFVIPLAEHPDSAFSLAATLFPLTSVATLAIRSLVSVVPAWQYAAAALVALVCGVFLVWLAGKAFRLSMLRYGQRLHLRELWRPS